MDDERYYRRKPKKILDATTGWNWELKGIYSILIDIIMLRDDDLPDDAGYIAGHIGCTKNRWTGAKKKLIQLGKIEIVDGKIVQNTAKLEQNFRKSKSKQAAKNRSKPNKTKGETNTPETHRDRDRDIEKEDTNVSCKSTDLPKRIFTAWNAMASKHGLAEVKTNILNVNRSKEILRRLADCKQDESLLFTAIANVPNNPHWLGHNDRGWKATFNFIFKTANFVPALEYETYTPPNGGNNGKSDYRANGTGKPKSIGEIALDNYQKSASASEHERGSGQGAGSLPHGDVTSRPSDRRRIAG
ncbi:MAG: hypothetical protein COB36_11525 [Alphaproteobacteria bacterium]|nr:MAG: hypothetical protein COB36_11525 [Alphaproteobacteria bacterium]